MDIHLPILIFGGILFGLASFALLYLTGRSFGVSGFVEACLYPLSSDAGWKALFLLGLLTGGVLLRFIYPLGVDVHSNLPLWAVFLSGTMVGVGTRMGKGCTSGHGLSGFGRLEGKSIVATCIFMLVAMVTATLLGGR